MDLLSYIFLPGPTEDESTWDWYMSELEAAFQPPPCKSKSGQICLDSLEKNYQDFLNKHPWVQEFHPRATCGWAARYFSDQIIVTEGESDLSISPGGSEGRIYHVNCDATTLTELLHPHPVPPPRFRWAS